MGLWERLQKLKRELDQAAQPASPAASPPKFTPPAPPKRETGTRKRTDPGTPLKTPADFAQRAQERMAKGDLDGAIADFNKAIELNPDFVEAYANRGVARERKGDTQGAKADYSKSIEIQIRCEIKRQLDAQNVPDTQESL